MSEVVYYLADYRVRLLEVGGIRGVAFAFYSESCDFGFGGFAVFIYDEVGECDVRAFGGEFECDGFADSASGTCYDRNFTC